MNERIIDLNHIQFPVLFGVHNVYLDIIKREYSKLKIVARGGQLKIYGEKSLMDDFEHSMQLLADHVVRYNSLDENSLMRILHDGQEIPVSQDSSNDIILYGTGGRIIKARTTNQRKMIRELEVNDLLFAVGPAGTGKTYTAVAMAVKAYKEKQVRRIILTRPAVEAGENLGFLPGDLRDKLDPYMQPLYDALRDMIPHQKLEKLMEKGDIQIAPLAYMRGRTLDESFVILDEAQNATHNQMKMFLTRMGKDAKFIITGDPGQVDLPKKQISGLTEALKTLKNMKGISIIYLNDNDVMRHRLVKRIIKAYDKQQNQE